jgi:protein-S-isoprenylcysteine O-methyltransferase Ste14
VITAGRAPELLAAVARPMTPTKALLLDLFERVLVAALYASLVLRIGASTFAGGSWASALVLPSEGLVLVFVLLRRKTEDVSERPVDWALALVATSAPLLVAPSTSPGHSLVPPAAAAAVFLMGILVQVHAKVVLGRSFGCVPANRGVRLAGPYRFVRHPMYAGYMLSHAAFLAMNPSWWNVALYVACDGLQIPRLLAEERLLSRDEAYRRYASTVPHRLIPGVF